MRLNESAEKRISENNSRERFPQFEGKRNMNTQNTQMAVVAFSRSRHHIRTSLRYCLLIRLLCFGPSVQNYESLAWKRSSEIQYI